MDGDSERQGSGGDGGQRRADRGDCPPRRVLVVSANIGGGHQATGRALAERVECHWPGSEVRWVDTLDAMGPWIGPLFRRAYVANVRATPWLYEFFYAALWRYPAFAAATKRGMSAWSGRRLATTVEQFDPDLILSTYPLGSAGLAWLRRHRSLPVPVGAWVSDFAPHPFWLYRELDTTYLMHEVAVPAARLAEPGIEVAVSGPPVESRFHRGEGSADRARLGLAADRFVVLVSCGAYGFGAVTEAVDALLAAGDAVQVVVACGRNRRLHTALATRGLPTDRLLVLGWSDEMPALTRAADLVVTNAGGATCLEALATGRPVVMYRPIAAHGVTDAALMSFAGLAETCTRPAALTALVSALATDGAAARRPVAVYLARHASDHRHDGHDRHDGQVRRASDDRHAGDDRHDGQDRHSGHGELPGLAALRRPAPAPRPAAPGRIAPVPAAWPLRPPDSFFLHVQTHEITQQVGAVITAVPEPGAAPLTAQALIDRIGASLPVLTTLRRRLVPRGDWRRPGWVADLTVPLAEHVRELAVPDEAALSAAIDEFWSAPVSLCRQPWELLVVRRDGTDVTTLAFKMHHAIGDGMSLIGTLDRLLETPDRPAPRRRGRPLAGPGLDGMPSLRGIVFGTRRVLRGMWELGRQAGAPRHRLNRPLTRNRRGVLTVPLRTDEVRAAARVHRVRSSELLLGVVAEALHRAGVAGGPGEPAAVRTMLPVAMAAFRDGGRTAGNRTGVVSVDLPVGPMGVTDRIHAIRGDLHRRMEAGEPHAAAFVMRALGMFPAPVHGWMARRVYNAQFFNMIASYLAGPLHQRRIAGNRLTEVYPVVALAEDVPLGVGIMRYAGVTGLCVMYDESLRATLAPVGDAVRGALRELLAG